MNSQRAWWIWGAGVFAYLVAVTQRTSFGVAGIEATDRFGTTAAVLSTFTVVQLLVYAGLQIPVGVLVDRFGSRLMIATGAVLMCAGQLQLAFADSVPAGILGRLLVGAGDATTFISVLRLVPAWFEARRNPMMTQLTSIVGQLGQLISVVPFAAVLHIFGWSPAFLSAASLSVLALILTLAGVRSYPPGATRHEVVPLRGTATSLSAAWRQPGTRLGFWSHFSTQFSTNVFVLMWGYPYLISAEGLPPYLASAVMVIFVVVAIVCGPIIGLLVARHPLRRSNLVLLISVGIGVAWAAVLLYPGPAPLWLLIVLVIVVATGGPGSAIGFDYARTFNPARRIGTATGIVNVAGFLAALLTMFLVGVILDFLESSGFSGGNLYALSSFRLALSLQLVVLAVGITGILLSRRRVRRQMAQAGVHVPPWREVLVRERARRQLRRR